MEFKRKCPVCNETRTLGAELGIGSIFGLADVGTGGKVYTLHLDLCLGCGVLYAREGVIDLDKQPKPK